MALFAEILPEGLELVDCAESKQKMGRREIQLRAKSGRIFVSGLVKIPGDGDAESVAAGQAVSYMEEPQEKALFFTAVGILVFHVAEAKENARNGARYGNSVVYDPVEDYVYLRDHIQKRWSDFKAAGYAS